MINFVCLCLSITLNTTDLPSPHSGCLVCSEATGSIGGRVTRRRKATVARNVTPPPAPNFEPSDEASTAEKENDREANGRPHHKGRPRRRAAKAAVAVAAALAAEEEAIRSEAEAAAAADAAAAAESEPPLPTSPVRTVWAGWLCGCVGVGGCVI